MRITGEGPINRTKATIDAPGRRAGQQHRLIVCDKSCATRRAAASP
jgi:hypothetical protein